MIERILELLVLNDFKGESELIDIAKGKYKLQTTFKGVSNQSKRAKAWQSKKK